MSAATKKPVRKKKLVQKKKAAPSQPRGYAAFTLHVARLLNAHRRVYVRLALTLFTAMFITTGLSQQSIYQSLADSSQVVSEEVITGTFGSLFEIVSIYFAVISGALSSAYSESQQLYVFFFFLYAWLSVVWLLRHHLTGAQLRTRDALYNAGAPLLSSIVVGVVFMLQLLPVALLTALVASLSTSGVLAGWVLLPVSAVLVVAFVATLYWLTSTLFAAVVVTIPGTYPVAALKTSRSLVAGYRLSILKRLLWLGGVNAVVFSALLLPLLAIDVLLGYAISGLVIAWIAFVVSLLMIYSFAYIYLLYRKVIDDRPA